MKSLKRKYRYWRFRWWLFNAGDWPIYRVTYKNGERTRPLQYLEAKSLTEVWTGKLWLDRRYAAYLFLSFYR